YSPFCVTAPVDPLLPGGGGNQLCGLYNISPAKFNQVSNLVTQASHYGTQTGITNAFDIFVNVRFGKGGQLAGGVSLATTAVNNCYVIDNPEQARPGFCHLGNSTSFGAAGGTPGTRLGTDAGIPDAVDPPWSAQSQFKINGSYPLPYGISAAAVYQNVPGTL